MIINAHASYKIYPDSNAINKITQYNIAFAICYIPWLCTYAFSCSDSKNFIACAVISFIHPLQGFFNAIIYTTSEEFRMYFKTGVNIDDRLG